MALALDVSRDAQDVRQRSHPGEDPDETARHRVGRNTHGGKPRSETEGLAATDATCKSEDCKPDWLPVLSGH